MEKKERARLKTVKFHARTGMIESNRVSAAAAADASTAAAGRRPPSPVTLGDETSPRLLNQSFKQTHEGIDYTVVASPWFKGLYRHCYVHNIGLLEAEQGPMKCV